MEYLVLYLGIWNEQFQFNRQNILRNDHKVILITDVNCGRAVVGILCRMLLIELHIGCADCPFLSEKNIS